MKDNDLFEAKIYFLTHLFIFLFFNVIIFVINFITMRGAPLSRGKWWFIYPLIGWGMGVFFHWAWIVLNKSHRIKKYKQKKAMEMMKYYG